LHNPYGCPICPGWGAVGAFVPWNNDDGLHPHGPCSGYAVYSSITGAFWQIRHERQKGFPLPGRCVVKCVVVMLHGLEKDPLVGEPILEKTQEPSEEWVLYQGACPVGHFAVRPEPFGYALVHSLFFAWGISQNRCQGSLSLWKIVVYLFIVYWLHSLSKLRTASW
jgi:hypothetical protein